MADRLRLEVVTPQRLVLELDVDQVELPGVLGEMGVLPGHTPLLTSLGTGQLSHRGPGGKGYLAIQGGFAEILPDRVTILAQTAERPADIDTAAAEEQRAAAEAGMKTASPADIDQLVAELRLAETRLEVARRAS